MKRHSPGFTLIELIIVLAIVAIIGAILIPNFLNTTERARFRSDIQSVRVLQNALDLHNIEQATPIPNSASMTTVIQLLDERGYIDTRRVTVQTDGADFILNSAGSIQLDISSANTNVRSTLYNQLSDQERHYVSGGTGGSG